MATRKRKAARKHEVRASLEVNQLQRAGSALHLEIYAEGEKIGDLTVGRGSIVWSGKRRWRERAKRISWSRFAEMMDELAYGS